MKYANVQRNKKKNISRIFICNIALPCADDTWASIIRFQRDIEGKLNWSNKYFSLILVFNCFKGNSIKWIFLRIFLLLYWSVCDTDHLILTLFTTSRIQFILFGFIFILPSSIKYSFSDFSLFIRFDWRNEQPSYHHTDDMHSIFMRRWFFFLVCLYCFCINLKQSQKRTTP